MSWVVVAVVLCDTWCLHGSGRGHVVGKGRWDLEARITQSLFKCADAPHEGVYLGLGDGPFALVVVAEDTCFGEADASVARALALADDAL